MLYKYDFMAVINYNIKQDYRMLEQFINNDYLSIFLGFLAGYFYYCFFEKRQMNKEFDMECWAKLHYMEKERSSLYMVHLKSIIVGIIVISISLKGCSDTYRKIIQFFGAGIIGLHVGQFFNEMDYIKNGNKHNYSNT